MQNAMNWMQQRYTFEAMADSPAFTASMMGQQGAGNMMGQLGATNMMGQLGAANMMGQLGAAYMMAGQPTANTGKTVPTGKAAKQQKQPADLFSMMAMRRAMGMEGIF